MLLEDYFEEIIDSFSDNLEFAVNYFVNFNSFFNYENDLDNFIVAVSYMTLLIINKYCRKYLV